MPVEFDGRFVGVGEDCEVTTLGVNGLMLTEVDDFCGESELTGLPHNQGINPREPVIVVELSLWVVEVKRDDAGSPNVRQARTQLAKEPAIQRQALKQFTPRRG